MPKKIFKAGNYGNKGSYSKEDLEKWVGKEFCITAGHVEDWKKNNYPTTAIPSAGTCKAVGVDEEGFLLGEFSYNEFGEKIKEQYPNVSIGVGADGPNHIALLGYAPPHIKDLDKSFSEFSVDLTGIEEVATIDFEVTTNEFAEGDEKSAQDVIDEFVAAIMEMDLDGVNIDKLRDKVWEISDITYQIYSLKQQGYKVEKETSEFSELTPKEIEEKLREEIKAEFTREQEMKDVKTKMLSKVPPVMKEIVEFAIDKAFDKEEYSNIIEFSENEKVPMATKLKEFNTTPFDNMFKTIVNEEEGTEKHVETPQEKARRMANIY